MEVNPQALPEQILAHDLARARALQATYFGRFFTWLIGTAGIFLLLFLLPIPEGHLLLPFGVITAGVQASFYLHFVDFARARARAIEARLNEQLGTSLLREAEAEALYFYPLDEPKFSGLSLANPTTFFSAFTLHWLFVWSFFYAFGALRAWSYLGEHRLFYFTLLGTWTSLNLAYLAWYFLARRDLKRVLALG